MSNKIIIEDPNHPDPEAIGRAAQIIKDGGVVVFPTWCLYGLGADALNGKAVDRVFQIKQRPSNKALLVLIKHRDQLNDLVKEIPSSATKIMDALWPGRITLIFEAKDHLPKNLTAGTGKIGIRLPEHPVAFALVNHLDTPLTGTSANITAHAGCHQISQMEDEVTEEVDLIIDSGSLSGGTGSTIVDITVHPPRILREGAIPAETILRILNPST